MVNFNQVPDLARRLGGVDGVDTAFERYQIDVIAALGESALCTLAAAVGYPIAAVPLSVLNYKGRSFGVCLVAGGTGRPATGCYV